MGILGKYSKECKTCTRRYPTSCSTSTCIVCREALDTTQKEPTVTEDEWKTLSYVHGRTIPGPLSDEDRATWESEWDALEAEAERRAPWWGVADLFADWSSVRPTS